MNKQRWATGICCSITSGTVNNISFKSYNITVSWQTFCFVILEKKKSHEVGDQ